MKRKLNYSVITDNLFVGRTPHGGDYKMLQDKGVNLIINMRAEWPAKYMPRQKLIPEIWVPSLDHKYFPINQKRLLKAATQAKKVIDDGGKVYVYCRMGRHRSIVMTAAILILQGCSVEVARKLITKQRPVADLRPTQVTSVIAEFEKTAQ